VGNEISIGAVGLGRHEKRGLGGSFMFMERGILEMECPHGPRARSEFLFILPMLLGPTTKYEQYGPAQFKSEAFLSLFTFEGPFSFLPRFTFFFFFWSWSPRIIPCLIGKFMMVNG
jgi:hypothetical protein